MARARIIFRAKPRKNGNSRSARLGLRGGIPRYVFSPYFRRIFLMSEYGPKYAYFRMGVTYLTALAHKTASVKCKQNPG